MRDRRYFSNLVVAAMTIGAFVGGIATAVHGISTNNLLGPLVVPAGGILGAFIGWTYGITCQALWRRAQAHGWRSLLPTRAFAHRTFALIGCYATWHYLLSLTHWNDTQEPYRPIIVTILTVITAHRLDQQPQPKPDTTTEAADVR